MGIYSSAHLVYGWKVDPESFIPEDEDDAGQYLEEKLHETGLGYLRVGGYDWSDFECDWVISVAELPSFHAGETATQLPREGLDEPGLNITVDYSARVEQALGVKLTERPGWFMGVSTG